MMNKKAALGGQTMIYVFLLVLIITGSSIAIGLGMFFSAEYDFRETDSQLLTNRLAKCLSENNILFPSDNSLPEELYQTCNINQEVIEKTMFISIDFEGQTHQGGRGDKTQCALSEKNNAYPKCTSTTIQISTEEMKIITGSNQNSRKVNA